MFSQINNYEEKRIIVHNCIHFMFETIEDLKIIKYDIDPKVLKRISDKNDVRITEDFKKCYYMYDSILYRINEGVSKLIGHEIDLSVLRKIIKNEDGKIITKEMYKIFKYYDDYTFALLFNQFIMDEPDSGDNRTIDEFRDNYYLTKAEYLQSKTTDLFIILFKYVDYLSNIQSINQNNL